MQYFYWVRPYRRTHFFIVKKLNVFCYKMFDKTEFFSYNGIAKFLWGCSSTGRALEWHSRGKGFDPPHLHQ